MPSREAGKPISRLTTYRVRPASPCWVQTAHRLLLRLHVRPRQRDYRLYLRDLVPYGGSSWWALSRKACEYVAAFADREVEVVAFFKNTVCPDESFFQTVLANSPFESRVARNLTYADWSRGGSSPATIDESHLAFFRATSSFDSGDVYGAGEMLFARKFGDDSGTLVAELDKQIQDRERPSSSG